MQYTYRLRLIAVCFVLVSTICGHAQVVVSSPEEIGAKGRQLGAQQQYDEGALTWYSIYADDKTIYVHLAIKDSLQKHKLLQNGMELWIDARGKKNKETGIMFPLNERAGVNPGGDGRNAAGGPPPFFFSREAGKNGDSVLRVAIGKKLMAEIKGFGNGLDGKQDITNINGISVFLSMQHDTLMYDAAIAMASLARQPEKGQLSIGIIEKGIDIPGFGMMDGSPDDGGGGPPPPPGGGSQGMMPPPGGPDDFDMRRIFEANSIWYRLKLHE